MGNDALQPYHVAQEARGFQEFDFLGCGGDGGGEVGVVADLSRRLVIDEIVRPPLQPPHHKGWRMIAELLRNRQRVESPGADRFQESLSLLPVFLVELRREQRRAAALRQRQLRIAYSLPLEPIARGLGRRWRQGNVLT